MRWLAKYLVEKRITGRCCGSCISQSRTDIIAVGNSECGCIECACYTTTWGHSSSSHHCWRCCCCYRTVVEDTARKLRPCASAQTSDIQTTTCIHVPTRTRKDNKRIDKYRCCILCRCQQILLINNLNTTSCRDETLQSWKGASSCYCNRKKRTFERKINERLWFTWATWFGWPNAVVTSVRCTDSGIESITGIARELNWSWRIRTSENQVTDKGLPVAVVEDVYDSAELA